MALLIALILAGVVAYMLVRRSKKSTPEVPAPKITVVKAVKKTAKKTTKSAGTTTTKRTKTNK